MYQELTITCDIVTEQIALARPSDLENLAPQLAAANISVPQYAFGLLAFRLMPLKKLSADSPSASSALVRGLRAKGQGATAEGVRL